MGVQTYQAGESGTWQLPSGTPSGSNVVVECWGGGGGGGGGSTTGSGGGGGAGGAYAKKTFVVGTSITAGSYYNYNAGTPGNAGFGAANGGAGGDTWFSSSTTVMAKGGTGGGYGGASAGAGATAPADTASYGDTKYKGGNGYAGSTSGGGGAGSSAGTGAAGNNATSATGATAPTGGGNGSSGATSGTPSNGSNPGGGGGGANDAASAVGGYGGYGKLVITYQDALTQVSQTCSPTYDIHTKQTKTLAPTYDVKNTVHKAIGTDTTLGKNNTTGTSAGATAADYAFGSDFTVTVPTLVTEISWYLDGSGGSVGTQPFRFGIYTTDGGTPQPAPQNLLGYTHEGRITNGDAAGWRTLKLTAPLALQPGTYWHMMLPGTPTTVIRCYRDTTTAHNGIYNEADTYSDGMESVSGGSGTKDSYRTYSAYASGVQMPTYDIRQLATKTLAPTYDIQANAITVSKTLSPTYDVRQLGTKTVIPTYDVRTKQTQTLTPTYSMSQLGTKALSATYNIINFATKTLAPEYDLRTRVGKTLGSSVSNEGLDLELVGRYATDALLPPSDSTHPQSWDDTWGVQSGWLSSPSWSGTGTDTDPYKAYLTGGSYLGFSNNAEVKTVPFTYELWVNPVTISGTWFHGLIMQESYLTNGFRLGLYNVDNPSKGMVNAWATQSGGTLSISGSTDYKVTAGAWNHVVFHYDGSHGEVWVNGVKAGEADGTLITPTGAPSVGTTITEPLDGYVAAVRRYHRVLSDAEIVAKNNAGPNASAYDYVGYDIRNLATKTLVATYDILSQSTVQKTLMASYDIRQLAAKTLAATYNILTGPFNKTVTATWDSRQITRKSTGRKNLWLNPSFETDTDSDGVADNVLVYFGGRSRVAGRTGGYAQRVQQTHSELWNFVTMYEDGFTPAIRDGEFVTSSIYYKLTTTGTAQLCVWYLEIRNSSHGGIGGGQTSNLIADGQWHRASVTAQAPPGSSYAIAAFYTYNVSADWSWDLTFDDALIELSDTLNPYYEGYDGIKYDIRQLATKPLVASYDLRQLSGAKTLTPTWNSRQLAGQQLVPQWDSRQLALKTLAPTYQIRNYAAKTLIATYDLRELVRQNIVPEYYISMNAGTSITITYSVLRLRGMRGYRIVSVKIGSTDITRDILERGKPKSTDIETSHVQIGGPKVCR